MPTEFEKKVGDYMTGTVIPGVVEHGWMVQGVMADPPFLYTVGLAMNVGYEILIAGLPLEHAADIVNDVAHHVMGAVNPPVDGALLHGIIEELPLRCRRRPPARARRRLRRVAVGVARRRRSLPRRPGDEPGDGRPSSPDGVHPNVTVLALAVCALAGYRIGRLAAIDTITEPVRTRLTLWAYPGRKGRRGRANGSTT
jgi:Domain of unknown function (DUF4262)